MNTDQNIETFRSGVKNFQPEGYDRLHYTASLVTFAKQGKPNVNMELADDIVIVYSGETCFRMRIEDMHKTDLLAHAFEKLVEYTERPSVDT